MHEERLCTGFFEITSLVSNSTLAARRSPLSTSRGRRGVESGRKLPVLQLACTGLAPTAKREDWIALASDDARGKSGMDRLHAQFLEAPVLGSLIDPTRAGATLLEAEFSVLRPILERAVARELSTSLFTKWRLPRRASPVQRHFSVSTSLS